VGKTYCQENTDITSQATLSRQAALEADVEQAIEQLFGDKTRVALRWGNGNKKEKAAHAMLHISVCLIH
jgi:hypothetical protein